MKVKSERTLAISGGQNSSSGSSRPHVRANTALSISIAMSQRKPSQRVASSRSNSPTAARSAGANALSWTTSGHAGKYGSRPRATIDEPTRSHDAGSRARSSAEPWMKYSG